MTRRNFTTTTTLFKAKLNSSKTTAYDKPQISDNVQLHASCVFHDNNFLPMVHVSFITTSFVSLLNMRDITNPKNEVVRINPATMLELM